MKIDKSEQIFLVLVPHRDTRLVLHNYRRTLLKTGFTGAHGFPWVAPLAALLRPLNPQELKNIAHSFRKSANDEKFRAGCSREGSPQAENLCTVPFPPEEKNSFLYGSRLDMQISQDLLNGAGVPFSQTVIGACLLQDREKTNVLPRPPELSFSAAAVANMFWQPVSLSAQDGQAAFGHKWKIGKLVWLPKKARQASALN